MKDEKNEEFSEIYDKDIFTMLDILENKNNKNRILFDKNIKKSNDYNYKNNSKLLNKQISKKRKIENERKTIISLTNYSIGNNLSNIKKQLNNISLNEKNTLKIKKRINKNDTPKLENKFKSFANKFAGWKKMNQISFTILKSIPYDIKAKNKELQNENDSLKENIKFLLSQIKKFKKKEITNDNNEKKEQSSNKDRTISLNNNKNTKNNNNNSNNNNNKINFIDIISKYKKEINSLKKELQNLSIENNKLKELLLNISKNEDEKTSIFNDKRISIKNSKKYSIIKNPLKNNQFFKKINPLNQKKMIITQNPYRKKSFNKTFSSYINEGYDYNTYNSEKSNLDKIIKMYNNSHSNKYDDKYSFINNDKNKRNMSNTININNGRKLILIDSDFTGNEKTDIHINAYTTKNKNFNDKLYSNNIIYNDINKNYISNKKYEHVKSNSFYYNDLYKKKPVN